MAGAAPEEMRCHAHRTDGAPCLAWACRGQRVCRVHGGAIKRNRAAAARRLAEAEVIEHVSRSAGLDPARAAELLGPGFGKQLRSLVRAAREQLDRERAAREQAGREKRALGRP